MRWLITGGCGFIGRNLIHELLKKGPCQILVVDNLSVGTISDLEAVCEFQTITPEQMPETGQAVRLLVADVLDRDLAIKVAHHCDVIVHLAANTGVPSSVDNPRQDCQVNVIGSLNYLEAAQRAKVKRFVFASSGAPIGICDPPIHEEKAPHPVSPYGASKLAGEGYCCAYYHSYGVETVALRFGNVYGPLSSRKTSVVAKFIKQSLLGETLEIYGDGNQTRDFLYVSDLVDAIFKAVTTEGIGGEIFQIATANDTTITNLTRQLISVLKEVNAVDSIAVSNTTERVGDVQRNYSDTTKAKERLQWRATVDLNEGLRKTVSWFLENKFGVTR